MTQTHESREAAAVTDGGQGGTGWGGVALDIAGVLSAVIIAVFLADILTDGRLSARFRRRGGGDDLDGPQASGSDSG